MWEKLYSKNGLAAKQIAQELIQLDIGVKIPRVSDYSEKLNFGRGTVQSAFSLLEEMKAINLEARGHLGTFLIRKDNNLLSEIAGISPLIGSMPLPYSRKYEGLATGIIEAFELTGKKIYLTYMRGGLNRIETVRTMRSDFAIVSKMTAEKVLSDYPNLKIIKNLGVNSYVSAHKIFLADSTGEQVRDGKKIGVDMDSLDQKNLTFAEFDGANVEYVNVNYMQLFEMLISKQIDAAVWNMDDRRMSQTFKAIDFRSPVAKEISEDTSEAVIIIDGNREKEFLEKWNSVEIDKILEIQASVESGDRLPSY
ncbi:GntR family transcriptional regulator YhfZ [Neobacillus novalis]|uniref:GntR family transcriptional regulator YhfZ n=1 Tax=Neobacillus novalis TaxID=220687 RepID=A0AA95MP95_9BACI|nr:GntR family transcriptional regulator YhfZ [Neobacillus novalis]WHY85839.1 GntR family transcriptional regulator YhfZ [Neobacillus novalis]